MPWLSVDAHFNHGINFFLRSCGGTSAVLTFAYSSPNRVKLKLVKSYQLYYYMKKNIVKHGMSLPCKILPVSDAASLHEWTT